MFQVNASARSRINAAFVTGNFICGPIGSGLASFLWVHGGWAAITLAGAIFSGFALTVWAVGRRGPLEIAPATCLAIADGRRRPRRIRGAAARRLVRVRCARVA